MKSLFQKKASTSSAKEFFLHLLSIVTLYVSVTMFIILVFQYINWLFPDVLSYEHIGILDTIRWSTATLLIVFPVYLVTMWLIHKGIAEDPAKAELRVRKWLTYFTLFLASLVIIVDLVTLVYNFLSGELTGRFLLKTLVVLIVAATVFGYYLYDLHRKQAKLSSSTRLVAWIVSLVVFGSIIGGFFLVGSPFYQRKVRFDERRVSDLQMLQGEIVNYWQQKEKLPPSLDDLKNSISGFVPPMDPESGASYEYKLGGKLAFELCANFTTSSTESAKGAVPMGYYDPYQQNWSHGIGRVCFSRTIDPEIYQPYPKPPRPIL